MRGSTHCHGWFHHSPCAMRGPNVSKAGAAPWGCASETRLGPPSTTHSCAHASSLSTRRFSTSNKNHPALGLALDAQLPGIDGR
eukprot:1416869-Rhodomonas_salina.1